jgi:hypothetical protein
MAGLGPAIHDNFMPIVAVDAPAIANLPTAQTTAAR